MELESQESLPDDRLTAFREAIDQRLGHKLDNTKRDQVLSIHMESLGAQDSLAEAFARGDMAPGSYFIEANRQNMATLSRIDDVLGEDDFIRLFDFSLEAAPPVCDPVVFAKAHGMSSPPELPDD